MLRREVRVTPHHLGTLPASQLLQGVQGRPVLHMPARPGMPQIVPAEVLNTGPLKGSVVWPTLQRTRAVPKSAFAAPGQRPEVQFHVESLAVTDPLIPPGPLLLVDDVVTKGRTLLACATALATAFPGVEIRGFALIRTTGLVPEVAKIAWPVVGDLSLDGHDAVREP